MLKFTPKKSFSEKIFFVKISLIYNKNNILTLVVYVESN